VRGGDADGIHGCCHSAFFVSFSKGYYGKGVSHEPSITTHPSPWTCLSVRFVIAAHYSSHLERLLIVCLFRWDPALPSALITENTGPILRFRMFPDAGRLITKLITSVYVCTSTLVHENVFASKMTLVNHPRTLLDIQAGNRGSTPLASKLLITKHLHRKKGLSDNKSDTTSTVSR
jgi:hypothetical protein